MTPEERTQDICYRAGWTIEPWVRSIILKAISAAIADERERCAQIAESFIPSGFTGDGKAGDTYAIARDDRARTIAAAIRKEHQP